MNKKAVLTIIAVSLGLTTACSDIKTDEILTQGAKANEYIILTDKLTQGEDYYGYEEHNIPLRIYISDDKIERVEAYEHLETEEYFHLVEQQLLPRWQGKTIREALENVPDAISGATYSSDAVIKSVRAGLEYAREKGLGK